MSEVPTQVILAAFKDEQGADAALKQLREAQKEQLIDLRNAAVLRRDQDGKLHISEPTEMGGGRGAAIGGLVGGLAGLVLGPVGWAALGGAAIGGIAAKLRDSGFKDERLRQLGENLQPGTSAILAVIEHIWVRELEEELQRAGADTVTAELGADIAQALKSGQDVAYTAIVTDDAVVAARATVDHSAQPAVAAPAAESLSAPAAASSAPASGASASGASAAAPASDAAASGSARSTPPPAEGAKPS